MREVENWLPVVGYEGLYEVSDLGRVRSLDRLDTAGHPRKGRVLKQSARGPYLRVILSNGKSQNRNVQHLVAEAFIGARPKGLVLRHLNGVAIDNRPCNLAWGTQGQNMLDKRGHGTDHEANKARCPLGHDYDNWNLVVAAAKRGQRNCLSCGRARTNARNQGRNPNSNETRADADRRYEELARANHVL